MEHFFTYFFQSKEKDKAADTLFIIIIKQMDKEKMLITSIKLRTRNFCVRGEWYNRCTTELGGRYSQKDIKHSM